MIIERRHRNDSWDGSISALRVAFCEESERRWVVKTIKGTEFKKLTKITSRQAVGSSIISPSWILTTASNLYNHHRARVFAGLIDRSNIIEAEYSSGEIYKNSFKIHPDFDETKPEGANIAMIKLCRAIHFSLNVDYARLPLNSHKDLQLKDRLATLSGFGDLGGK